MAMVALKVEYDVPDWNQIYTLLIKQSERICTSGFRPDIIVGVCRGGWIPARVLSDLLDNPNLANVGAESYLGVSKSKEPVLTQCVSTDVKCKKVLVVDEIADSGKSLQLIIHHLQSQGAQEIKTATLYYKPTCAIKPDFYEKETLNWVIFPWDTKEVLQEIYALYKDNKHLLAKQAEKLDVAGVSKHLINKIFIERLEAETC
jgi:hypoxanthine phosphoribosyltransferase